MARQRVKEPQAPPSIALRTEARVTVMDVAKRAGVHSSTVSRALTAGTARVSEGLVARVLAAAEELSYRPNRLARALRMHHSSSVGMLIPDISNPAYPPIVRGAEDALTPSGISVLIASTDNDPRREAEVISLMLDQRVDGLLLATATRKYSPLEALLNAHLPVVLINRRTGTGQLSLVRGDDELGVRLAVQHLRSLGHEKIAHLAGTDAVSSGYDRRRAFIKAMRASGVHPDPVAIVSADQFKGPVGVELGHSLTRELLQRHVPFTAVIAANDLLAIGCYDVLKADGRSIPHAVSVIGYNDIGLVDRLSPPLTTIRIPLYQIGLRAGQSLLDRITGTLLDPESLSLAPTLVIRASTAHPMPAPVHRASSRRALAT